MSKHTLGPWHYGGHLFDSRVMAKEAPASWSTRTIAIVDHTEDEMGEANAHLIAAAPDLLQELEDMIGHCRGCDGKGRRYGPVPGRPGSYAPDQPCQDCSDARAAIKKARGK